MSKIADDFIDLTVTSPPYDDLRTYNGYNFDFENTAKELFRITKAGGVVVWVVNDETKNGCESLTSFKQALYFKEIGFNVETMIWEKPTFTATGALKYRYGQVFEYMFVLSKGNPAHFNPIKDRKNKCYGDVKHGNVRQIDGSTKEISSKGKPIAEYGQRFNVWRISPEKAKNKKFHPAQFPEELVSDHIISWSNEGDIVFDPMCGSGTTCVMANKLKRKFIGCNISSTYCDIANKRIQDIVNKST